MATDFDDLADAYLHGLLSPEEAKAFERRLQADERLQTAVETARRRLALVEAALPPAEASEPLVRATLARIDRDIVHRRARKRRQLFLFWVPVAAAVLFLGFFHIHFASLSASPVNLEVYGQDEWLPGSETAIHVRLVDRKTQQPLEGVAVQVELREIGGGFTSLAESQTDAQGHSAPAFRLPDWPDGSYELRVRADAPLSPEVLTRSVRLKRSHTLMLSSDKPRYQPGQTIHLRILALQKHSSRPAIGQTAHFSVRDPRGRNIFQSSQETNRFGLAAIDVPLNANAPLGSYRVACSVADTVSETVVSVERYTLPQVKLTITTDKAWYREQEEVVATLDAAYFDGRPASGQMAEFEVSRPLHGTSLQIDRARLNDDGKAVFRYRVPPVFIGSEQVAHVELSARIGQAPKRLGAQSITVPIARQSIVVQAAIGAATVPDAPRRTTISLHSPDGQAVATRGLIHSGDRSYPFVTDAAGNAEMDIRVPENVGTLQIEVTAPDGVQIVESLPVTISMRLDELVVQTDRSVYRAGQTVHIVVHGPNEPVFLDFRRENQTLRSATVAIQQGRGEYHLDIPAEMHGEWTIIGGRMRDRFQPASSVKVIVEPAVGVKVQAAFNRDGYRPGDTANVRLQLTDDAGKSIAGALSLAMVNEAVYFSWPARVDRAGGAAQSDYPLHAETYAQKHAEVARSREDRLQFVRAGWIGLGTLLVLALYAWMWTRLRTRYMLFFHGVLLIALLCGGGLYFVFELVEADRSNTFKEAAESAQPVADAAKRSPAAGSPLPISVEPPRPTVAPPAGAQLPIETLLWKPIVLTDETGRAELDIPLGGTVTTWRFAAQAVTGDGRLGGAEKIVRVAPAGKSK